MCFHNYMLEVIGRPGVARCLGCGEEIRCPHPWYQLESKWYGASCSGCGEEFRDEALCEDPYLVKMSIIFYVSSVSTLN